MPARRRGGGPHLLRLAVGAAGIILTIVATLLAPRALAHVVEPPFHSNVQIHVLGAGGSVTALHEYSLGDWAGPWWVADEDPAAARKEPILAVGFQTTLAAGGPPVRQSHLAVLRHAGGGRFTVAQVEPVGAADSDIHHVRIFQDVVGDIDALDVYEGSDPTGRVTVHHFTWDAGTATFLLVSSDPNGALPSPLPAPAADQMQFGAGGSFTSFDVTTNASGPQTSRLRLVAEAAPPALSVGAIPRGGTHTSTVALLLVSNDTAAEIRYTSTSDGSDPPDPDGASPLFGPGPILLTPRTTSTTTWRLKAKAILGAAESAVAAETYLLNVPLFVDSDGDGLPDIWEAANGFDPLLPDSDRDTDLDGWSDFDELRLGSDPGDPASVPAGDPRNVRFSGSASRPDGSGVAAAKVLTISPGGADLLSDPSHGDPVDPNDPSLGVIDAHAVTDPNGDFAGARTLGEAHVILTIADPAAPRVVLHRFAPDTLWDLPPRDFEDPAFFSDPNVLSDPVRLADPNTWFDQYRANLMYDIEVSGLSVDARSEAVLQILEKEVETILPGLVLAHHGVPVEMDADNPPLGDFPGPGDVDLDRDGELDGDLNNPPLEIFPDAGDVDLDLDGAFDGYSLTLGRPGRGIAARRLELVEQAGEPLAALGAAIQEAVENPNNPTYGGWVSFTEDLLRAAPDCPGFFGTTDDVLTGALDGQPIDPTLAGCLAALPAAPPPGGGGPEGAVAAGAGGGNPPRAQGLPPDLAGLAAAVRGAARATGAILGRALLRGEAPLYERGDPLAPGSTYRGIAGDLAAARAGDLSALSDIIAGAEQAARAVEEARALASSGRAGAVANLRRGIAVLAAALDEADGDPVALGTLDARMNGLVYRIDRAAPDPNALAALEAAAAEFLLPDLDPPVVTASPPGPLFTGSLSVSLISDEPATIYYTLDGSDPSPGGGSTFIGVNEVAGIPITTDTTLSWFAEDDPWLNASSVDRITYLHDADADAVADLSDNCPSDYNPGQDDFDGDALGDLCDPDDDNDLVADGADCRPFDPTVWASPAGLPITLAFADGQSLQWTSLAAAAGPATVYDLISGMVADAAALPPGFRFDSAVCLLDGAPSLGVADPQVPPPGEAFYYLLRAENVCGPGSYGPDSDGLDRSSPACP